MTLESEVRAVPTSELSARGLATVLVPGIPAYRQITTILENRVRNGVYPPGDLIPSEARLCEEFGVSRVTIRQACTDLVAQGLLVRHQGRGTSVPLSYRPFGPPASSGYLEDILVFYAATKLARLERKTDVPPPDVADKLRVPTRRRLTVFSAWRTLEDQPFSYSLTYTPTAIANQIGDESLLSASLVELLDRHFGARMSGAEQLLWASVADETVAPQLDVAVGAPILALGLTYYTADGDPAFYSRSLFRGDRYVHHVRLGRLPT